MQFPYRIEVPREQTSSKATFLMGKAFSHCWLAVTHYFFFLVSYVFPFLWNLPKLQCMANWLIQTVTYQPHRQGDTPDPSPNWGFLAVPFLFVTDCYKCTTNKVLSSETLPLAEMHNLGRKSFQKKPFWRKRTNSKNLGQAAHCSYGD
jgi:hypothetical protein